MNNQYGMNAGYWDAGKFIRHIHKVQDGKHFPTGYYCESYGASNDEQKFMKHVMEIANTYGIDKAAELYPRALIKNQPRNIA